MRQLTREPPNEYSIAAVHLLNLHNLLIDAQSDYNEMEASDVNATLAVEDCVNHTPRQGGVSSRRRLADSRCSARSVNSGFKSPVQKSNTVKFVVSPEDVVKESEQTLDRLNSEITLLEKDGFVEAELDQHIDLLHEYNDIKDTAQTLLGRLASLRGVTTRDLYSHFSLELDD